MSVFREADYRPLCRICGELSSWICPACQEPRCGEHEPEYGPWCESCEEGFGEAVVREGLYMRPVGSREKKIVERPAYWRWYHGGRSLGVGVGTVAGAIAYALARAGVTVGAAVFGVFAIAFCGGMLASTRDFERHLTRRLGRARRRFIRTRRRELPAGDVAADD